MSQRTVLLLAVSLLFEINVRVIDGGTALDGAARIFSLVGSFAFGLMFLVSWIRDPA